MSRMLDMAIKLAWPKQPKSKRWKYSYKKGSPTKAFKKAYKKVYPGVSMKKAANCDRAASVIPRILGIEKMPSGNEQQLKYKPKHMRRKAYKNKRPIDVVKPGDMVVVKKKNGKRHTFIMGHKCIYEATHKKTYFHRNGSLKKLKKKYPKVVIFRER